MKYLTYSELQKIAIKSHGLLKVNGNEATITWIDGNVGFRNYAIGIDGKEQTFSDFRLFIKEKEASEVLQHEKIDTRILNHLRFEEVEEMLNDIPKVLVVVEDGIANDIRSNFPVNMQVVEFDEANGYPGIEQAPWEDTIEYQRAELFSSVEEMEQEYKNRWNQHIESLQD